MDTELQLLYHYTSQKGLLGVVKNNEVWATDILYLNDSMEYKYAVDLTSEIIRERQESFKDKASLEYSMLEDLDRFIKKDKNFHTFVFSLSKEGNTLSQWRGYCPNNNGYSIGFNPTALERIISGRHFKLVECIYDDEEQKELINGLVDKFVKDVKSDNNILFNSTNSQINLDIIFLLRFLPIASILKHKSFEEEQEWRLISDPISTGSKEIKFREGTSTTIPYITINLKEGKHVPIEHIFIGPTGNELLSKRAVLSLLAVKEITNCKVGFSGIPYRPLN